MLQEAGKSKRPRRSAAWPQQAQTQPFTADEAVTNTAAASTAAAPGSVSAEQQVNPVHPNAGTAGVSSSRPGAVTDQPRLQRRTRQQQKDDRASIPKQHPVQENTAFTAAEASEQPDLASSLAVVTSHLASPPPRQQQQQQGQQQPSTAQWDPGISLPQPDRRLSAVDTANAPAERASAAAVYHQGKGKVLAVDETPSAATAAAAAVLDAEKASTQNHASVARTPSTAADTAGQITHLSAAHHPEQHHQSQVQQQQQQQQQEPQAGDHLHPTPSWLKLLHCELEDNSKVLLVRLQLANRSYTGRLTLEPAATQQQHTQQQEHLLQQFQEQHAMSQQAERRSSDPYAAGDDPQCHTARGDHRAAENATGGQTTVDLQQGSRGAQLGPDTVAAALERQQADVAPLFAAALVSQQMQTGQEATLPQQSGPHLGPQQQMQRHLQQLQEQSPTAAAAAAAADTLMVHPAASRQQHTDQQQQQLPPQQPMVYPAAPAAAANTGYEHVAGADAGHSFRPPATRASTRMMSAFALHQKEQQQQQPQQQQQQQQQSQAGGTEHPVVVVQRATARKRRSDHPDEGADDELKG